MSDHEPLETPFWERDDALLICVKIAFGLVGLAVFIVYCAKYGLESL